MLDLSTEWSLKEWLLSCKMSKHLLCITRDQFKNCIFSCGHPKQLSMIVSKIQSVCHVFLSPFLFDCTNYRGNWRHPEVSCFAPFFQNMSLSWWTASAANSILCQPICQVIQVLFIQWDCLFNLILSSFPIFVHTTNVPELRVPYLSVFKQVIFRL